MNQPTTLKLCPECAYTAEADGYTSDVEETAVPRTHPTFCDACSALLNPELESMYLATFHNQPVQ